MKRVIVTGGTGFIGANLTRRLLRDGHEVHLLVRPQYARWRIAEIDQDLRIHEIDLGDVQGLDALILYICPDWAFHLAAYGAYPSQVDLRQMINTNIVGTYNLAQACVRSGVESFINAGSSSEYGRKDHPPDELERLEPDSDYAVTKASATHFCCHLGRNNNMRFSTLRLYSVYGPYEEPTRLIPTLITEGLEGRLPPLVSADTARDFVYVDDVSRAFILAASLPQQPGSVYNVGTGRQTTLGEIVSVAQHCLNIPAQPQWESMASRSWDTNVWIADNRLIGDTLGWQPQISVSTGFQLTVDWLLAHPPMRQHYSTYRQLPC